MLGIITAVLPIIGKVFERILPEDPEKRREAEMEIQKALIENADKLELAAADIIKAEAQSEHKITSQWRPILMLGFTAMIMNNFMLAPYLEAIFGWSVVVDLPDHVWELLKIGVGGYIIGRSGEKMVKGWKS